MQSYKEIFAQTQITRLFVLNLDMHMSMCVYMCVCVGGGVEDTCK